MGPRSAAIAQQRRDCDREVHQCGSQRDGRSCALGWCCVGWRGVGWRGVGWCRIWHQRTERQRAGHFGGTDPCWRVVRCGFLHSRRRVAVGGGGRAITNCPAQVQAYGSGCIGPAGPVVLTALTPPWSGGEYRTRIYGRPGSSLALNVLGATMQSLPLAPNPAAEPERVQPADVPRDRGSGRADHRHRRTDGFDPGNAESCRRDSLPAGAGAAARRKLQLADRQQFERSRSDDRVLLGRERFGICDGNGSVAAA